MAFMASASSPISSRVDISIWWSKFPRATSREPSTSVCRGWAIHLKNIRAATINSDVVTTTVSHAVTIAVRYFERTLSASSLISCCMCPGTWATSSQSSSTLSRR